MVIEKITNEENLHKGRIHPMTIILALKVYSSGSGIRTEWKPVPAIKDALEDAFYKAFKYVEPTNKKYLLGIDVSGSMGGFSWGSSGKSALTPREAASVVAMTIARTEKNHLMMAFTHQFSELSITAKDSLDTVVRKTSCANFGGTDCALPMVYASQHSLDVDVFVVLTDNETHSGSIHPFQALKEYRQKFNKDAKLAVLAFEASEFSIADPEDAGMMDIAGLDSNVPKVLSEFALGNI
jgi:60 kDa SS-A/Ro ribonucleoprotein